MAFFSRIPIAAGLLMLLPALCLLSLASCSGNEPQERQAFIAFLNDTIAPRKGVSLPELSGAQEKAFGRYTEHYALLTDFQKNLAEGAGKNAHELLSLAGMENLAALAGAERSLRKAVSEAEKLQKLIISLRDKADKAKAELAMPDDLAPVYDPIYAKVVSLPAVAAAEAFKSVRSVFAAILDLLDFINANSRDIEIDGKNIHLKNIGLKDELDAKMAAAREQSEALRKVYIEMMRTMLR